MGRWVGGGMGMEGGITRCEMLMAVRRDSRAAGLFNIAFLFREGPPPSRRVGSNTAIMLLLGCPYDPMCCLLLYSLTAPFCTLYVALRSPPFIALTDTHIPAYTHTAVSHTHTCYSHSPLFPVHRPKSILVFAAWPRPIRGPGLLFA